MVIFCFYRSSIDSDICWFLSCCYMIYDFYSMLLLSGLRGNYCFKNIKPLLIVCSSLSNLSPQVNIVHHKRGCGFPQTVSYLQKRGLVQSSKWNSQIISKHLIKTIFKLPYFQALANIITYSFFFKLKCSWFTILI